MNKLQKIQRLTFYMEEADSSELPVTIKENTGCANPKDHKLNDDKCLQSQEVVGL
jgi:hypothetical protein